MVASFNQATIDLARPIVSAVEGMAETWILSALEDDDLCEGGAIGGTDSPIEAQLLVSIAFMLYLIGIKVSVLPRGCSLDLAPSSGIAIIPQFKLGKYRTDFAIMSNDLENLRICIECDGHQYHAMTKEQAANDNKRDRYFQSIGYTVLRFTGSEIHAKSDRCAMEVYRHIERSFPCNNIDAGALIANSAAARAARGGK